MLNFSGTPNIEDLTLAATLLIKQQLPGAVELVPAPSPANNWCFDEAKSRFVGDLLTADGDRLAWSLDRTADGWRSATRNLEFAELSDRLLSETELDRVAPSVLRYLLQYGDRGYKDGVDEISSWQWSETNQAFTGRFVDRRPGADRAFDFTIALKNGEWERSFQIAQTAADMSESESFDFKGFNPNRDGAGRFAKSASSAIGAIRSKITKDLVVDTVVNTAGLAGSAIGGKLGGTAGALAGDVLGAMTARAAIRVTEAGLSAKAKLSRDRAFQNASRLQKMQQLSGATLSEMRSNRFKRMIGDDLTGDVGGWAIGNSAATLLSAVPGVGGIPFKGAAVAMATVPRLVEARRRLVDRNREFNEFNVGNTEFAEPVDPFGGLDEQGRQDLIDVLDEVYTDGVERIVGAKLDDVGDIRVVFEDINGSVVRRFVGKIEDPKGSPIVSFKLAFESPVQSRFQSFAAPVKTLKPKNCKPGKSISCGLSCISLKKTCRKTQALSPEAAAKASRTAEALESPKPSAPDYPKLDAISNFDGEFDRDVKVNRNTLNVWAVQDFEDSDSGNSSFYFHSFAFKVNSSLNAGTADKRSRLQLALTARSEFRKELQRFPDGSIVECTAWSADGKGQSRESIYQSFGFGKADELGRMWAVVRSGKLIPIEYDVLKARIEAEK